jgi:1,4-dihydroxy-2-naphthoyl-CoA hydrolase
VEIPPEWADQQLNDKMGLQVLESSIERVVGTMPVDGNRQPFGLLHGGASCVLAETLASFGAALHGETMGKTAAGLELNATHLRSAVAGIVTGVATPLHLGGSIATYEVIITDEQDRKVCVSRVTCVLRATESLRSRAVRS